MSRSYSVLAAALIGPLAFAGALALVERRDPGGSAAPVEVVDAVASPIVDGPDAWIVGEEASVEADCAVSLRLQLGDTDPEVACLETQLIAAGALRQGGPDQVFDAATEAAVRAFQSANGLVVDGVVGPQTAAQLGIRVGSDLLSNDSHNCPDSGRSAVVDRFNQRAWLCEAGEITEIMPMTSAVSQPDPGTYQVYAKDLRASSSLNDSYSEMTHFVAFTYGENQGARIAFHSVPRYRNGEYVQPLDSVGAPERFGESAGCIRVLPEHAELIWNWLDVGDTVEVVT